MGALRKESGQDLVEFALIAPILFAVLFGIVEFGVAVWRYNTLANTARETAREFVVYPKDQRGEAAARAFALDYARDVGRLTLRPEDVTYGEPPLVITGTTGAITYTTIAVTVSHNYHSITGLFGEIPMQARASMLAEGER